MPKGLSVGFILKPNYGAITDLSNGKTYLGYKEGHIALVIVPDDKQRKSRWLEGRTSGFIELGRFQFEQGQRYEFDIETRLEQGMATTIPELGRSSSDGESYCVFKTGDKAIVNCHVNLSIVSQDKYTQEFTPLLINLIRTRKAIDLGFHAEDNIEVQYGNTNV